MTAGTVVITGGILATVILLCIIAVLCYCRLQVLGAGEGRRGKPGGGPAGVGAPHTCWGPGRGKSQVWNKVESRQPCPDSASHRGSERVRDLAHGTQPPGEGRGGRWGPALPSPPTLGQSGGAGVECVFLRKEGKPRAGQGSTPWCS